MNLTRDEAGLYTLKGSFLRQAEIYISPDPEHFEQLIAIADQTQTITIPSPDRLRRYYFLVRQHSQPDMILGTRRLPLEGSLNFRDLGGYKTIDGYTVKWGKVFRGDAQDRMTDDDIAYMNSIGFKLICDLRGDEEAAKRPGKLALTRLHLPIHDDLVNGQLIQQRLESGDATGMDETMMRGSYQRILDQYPHIFGSLLREIAKPENLPIAFHCTAGKDRTGLTAAMLLTLLDVPKQTIIADYDLTNGYVEPFLKWMRQRVESNGIDFDQIKPIFSAPVTLLLHAYDYLDENYGGMLPYLRNHVGIDEATQEQLKAILLASTR